MPGFQIQFEAVDEASPTIQRLSQMMLDAAQKGDKFAADLYSSSDRINTSLNKIKPSAKEAEDSLGSLRQAGSQLSSQFLGLASIAGLTAFFKSSADEALRQEEALRRLGFAVDSTGGSFSKSKDQIMGFAEQQQNLTQFSQTQTFEAMGRLVRITGDVGQAMQATRLVFGLASTSGRDFNSIMDLLSPILQGDSSRLRALQSEFGSFIGNASTAQEVIDNLSKRFLGAAERQSGFALEIQRSKNVLSDFQEKVGQGVLPVFNLLLKGLEAVAEFTEKLATGFASDTAIMVEAFKFLGGAMKDAITLNLDGIGTRFKEFQTNTTNIYRATGEEIAEIDKRYSHERVQTEQDEARLKAGVRRKTLEEIQREAEDRKKLENDAHDFIGKLDADLLKNQKKNLDAKLKIIETEKEDRIQKLDEFHQKGILTEEQLRTAYAETAEIAKLKSKESREEMDKDFQAEKEGAKKVGEAFASSIGSAFADIIVEGKSMQEAFDAAFKQILKTAIETFTRIAIESAVLRGSTDGMGMLGGMLMVGGFASGAFKGFHLQEGGIVRQPTIAQIGEGGPEAVIPLSKLGPLGGPSVGQVNVTVTQNNTISVQGVNDDQVKDLMKKISQATRNGASEGAELVKSILSRENRLSGQSV